MTARPTLLAALSVAALVACSGPVALDPIFIGGRAISAAGDSVIAVTRSGSTGLVIRRRRSGGIREIGAAALKSPRHSQWVNGEWFVSDVENGKPSLVVLDGTGALKRQVSLERFTRTPHQFAVLPDGRIVVESPEGALVAFDGDSATIFTLTDRSSKPGIVLAAAGGVLHAIPDKYITLYNEFGHVRWRLEWPWQSSAYVGEITVDPNGRIHALLGVPGDGTFRVYTLSNMTGEVLVWSPPGNEPTFVVDRLGKIRADKADKWLK